MSYVVLAALVWRKICREPSGMLDEALTVHRHNGTGEEVILCPAATVAPPSAPAISLCLSVLHGSVVFAAPAGVTEAANARASTTMPTMVRLFMHPSFL